jgi:DNA-binding transcriptional MerR regulator
VVITIGQLARYAGVSIKTVRVYHAKGLLPEPERDASGYRRYSARHAIDLVKIRTLAEAGLPLSRIADLRDASPEDARRIVHQTDVDLTARIRRLRRTQRRLRALDTAHLHALPPEVAAHLTTLPTLGFSSRWVALQTDLWTLLVATHPDTALVLLRDQAQALTDPVLLRICLEYDQVHDLDPGDPRIDDLVRRVVTATRSRYGDDELPGQAVDSAMPALVQATVNASSPAWRRFDDLVRRQLGI